MDVLLRLFSTEEKAADGSTIPRSSVEQYLQSDDYKQIIEDHISVGGRTHKDRKPRPEYEGLVGPNDQVMISDNITHYITKIFLKDNDPICYGIIHILDPDDYGGKRRENIKNLIGDLKAGMKIPVSIVISALWSYDNVAEKISRIRGVDFTFDPSFGSAGTEKIFSSIPSRIEESKTFSNTDDPKLEGCTYKTVAFSSTFEIMNVEQTQEQVKTYSLLDIASKYGLGSKVYSRAKQFGDVIDEGALASIIEGNLMRPEDYPEDYFNEDENPEDKEFSTTNSVRDRMYLTKFPRFVLVNRIFKSYKQYYENKGDSLTDTQFEFLQLLLIQDLGILIRNILPQLMNGRTISAMYALIQFNKEIYEAGIELSKIYRLVLLSEKNMGFVPANKYKKWKEALINFYSAVIKYCFGCDMTLNINSIDQINKL